MIIKGVYIENSDKKLDIRIKDGIFEEIGENLYKKENEEEINADGKLALPPFRYLPNSRRA